MLPTSIFFVLLGNLLALALLSLNTFLVYKWYEIGFSLSSIFFISSVIITMLNFFGWLIVPILLSKSKGQVIRPEKLRTKSVKQDLFVQKYLNKDIKTTLIFTHGWSTTAQIWSYFGLALTGKYNLIFWDEPGLGLSKIPENRDFSLSKYANNLQEIVETVSPTQKIILVGHSIGGMIIQQFYQDFPLLAKERISANALFNTTYINPIKTALFGNILVKLQNILIKPILVIQKYTWPIWQLNNALSFCNGSLHLAAFASGFTGQQTQEELKFTTRLMMTSRVDVVSDGTLEMTKLNTFDTLKDILVPTLVIAGKKDILTLATANKTISELLPNSTLKIIENAGHMGILEQSQTYIQELEKFLERNNF